MLPPHLCAGFKVNSMVHRFDLYLSCTGGIHAKLHAHSHTQRESCGSNTSKVNNLTGVKPSFSLPPPFSFALVFFYKKLFIYFLAQHSFSARAPVPLSINYLYCLCSDLWSSVTICMDGAREACLILCHREFSIFI